MKVEFRSNDERIHTKVTKSSVEAILDPDPEVITAASKLPKAMSETITELDSSFTAQAFRTLTIRKILMVCPHK